MDIFLITGTSKKLILITTITQFDCVKLCYYREKKMAFHPKNHLTPTFYIHVRATDRCHGSTMALSMIANDCSY